jgi:hypothetical protein
VQRALDKDHIDEVIRISEQYKEPSKSIVYSKTCPQMLTKSRNQDVPLRRARRTT